MLTWCAWEEHQGQPKQETLLSDRPRRLLTLSTTPVTEFCVSLDTTMVSNSQRFTRLSLALFWIFCWKHSTQEFWSYGRPSNIWGPYIYGVTLLYTWGKITWKDKAMIVLWKRECLSPLGNFFYLYEYVSSSHQSCLLLKCFSGVYTNHIRFLYNSRLIVYSLALL